MRQQERAHIAFKHVSDHEGKTSAKKYGVHCMKTPTLLKTAGLVQTLEFLATRRDDEAKGFLKDLAAQLFRVDTRIDSAAALRTRAREAELQEYLLLSRELDACLIWYRRFAQSILKVDPTDEPGGDQ